MTTHALPSVGDVIGPLVVGPVAHGGHWVARTGGRVIFVRHALEGEQVRVRITSLASRHGFGDVVEVLEPSPHRVVPPCPVAGQCGGCDFQHVAAAHQRDLKQQIVAEQLLRLSGISWDGVVESVSPDSLGWRTRMRYAAGKAGWGLRSHRSGNVVSLPAEGCRLAVESLARPADSGVSVSESPQLLGVASNDGVHWVRESDDREVTELAAGRAWQVAASGFWQVHPQAADVLADAVLAGLEPRAGEHALDLFCGVGLFAGALANMGVQVHGIEGDRRAVQFARRNVPEATFAAGPVERLILHRDGECDLIVLDPPRAGARRRVMEAVIGLAPRRIAYVACDPAALARDLATALGLGYQVTSVRAFDLFPSTNHVECVAILQRPS